MSDDLAKARYERALKTIERFAPTDDTLWPKTGSLTRDKAIAWIKTNFHDLYSARTEELCDVIAIIETVKRRKA